MYILSDTRFKEQISSSAFMVRGHRSHRYASAFQSDRHLRLTTKGWNPLPFFPHHRRIGPLRYNMEDYEVRAYSPYQFLPFFLFFYSSSSFHSSIDGFPQIPVKIGKNCDLQSRHRSLYHLDLVSICIQSRFEAIILGMICWKKYSILREDEGNMSNYFEKYL